MRIASGQGGPIRWALDAQGPALDFLTTKNRNALIRDSLTDAGYDWGVAFLPKRFSHYVERRPFPYPGHHLGFYFQKAKRMGLLTAIIKRLSLTQGWDPWSSEKPPFTLIKQWKELNPGKYTGATYHSGLITDMRNNAKRAIKEVIDEMWGDGKFIPLVESGTARQTATTGFRPRAVATASNAILRVAIPFGHPVNRTVSNVVKTAPHWEVKWIAKKMTEHMVQRLKARGLAVGPGGTVTTRTPPAPRATAAVAARGIYG